MHFNMLCVLLAFLAVATCTSVGHPAEHPVYHPSCHRCSDGDCSPRVCRYPGNCDYSCMDCRTDDNCKWTQGARPFCAGNNCVQCTGAAQCASNSNCDVSCDSNSCVSHSQLDCTTLKGTPYCLIGNAKCVECLDNSQCGPDKPYCSSSNTCEVCLNNFHCRNATHCNALCAVGNTGLPGMGATCQPPSGEKFLHCKNGTVCYDWLAQCYDTCEPDVPSGNINGCPPLNSTVDGDLCNPNDGKCYLCVTDNDCKTSLNQTCGAACQFNGGNHQYQCSTGTACTTTQNCIVFQSTGKFGCSGASSMNVHALLICLVLLFWAVVF